jgi:hypothetical protein
MATTTDILHKARQIQADAQHLAFSAENKHDKETMKLVMDLARALEDLTQLVAQMERTPELTPRA